MCRISNVQYKTNFTRVSFVSTERCFALIKLNESAVLESISSNTAGNHGTTNYCRNRSGSRGIRGLGSSTLRSCRLYSRWHCSKLFCCRHDGLCSHCKWCRCGVWKLCCPFAVCRCSRVGYRRHGSSG
ncbi:hypothetical protein DPEC_G00315330 [Dallia pectoralis]|uniref:Uncharacterized protein n=1 Tax=Dallia pectoralis TaxID=75939 RepID=A0ACC2FC93_DALPE|nr:hypothetical protein DPEC_G00315330 [Dallia pectoralis]